jgi:hypothetical protein
VTRRPAKSSRSKERPGAISDTELDDYWATLAPVTFDGMIGEWESHRINGQLKQTPFESKSAMAGDSRQYHPIPRFSRAGQVGKPRASLSA